MSEFTIEVALMANGVSLGRELFNLSLPVEAEKEGADYFLQEAIMHLRQELLYGQYTEAIPIPDDLWPHAESGKRTFTEQDMFTGHYEDVMNTGEIWRLVWNLILAVRVWLAKAKAFGEVWQSIDSSDERLRAAAHYEKMDQFNLAVYGIYKLRDLCIRVISEALGHAIFKVDYDKEDWEESINAGKLHAALGKREEYEELRTMRDKDFDELKTVAARLMRKYNDTTKAFLEYRNKLTHGNPASVDDSKYFHQLEDRRWEPMPSVDAGKPKGCTKRRVIGLGRPEWTSGSLYSCLVQALDHYVATLRMLKAIPCFGG
jgi:hypothetical protein